MEPITRILTEQDDSLALRKYLQTYSRYSSDGVIDLDKRLRQKFDFQIYRLEDVVPMVNGVLPPSRQTPYWITLVKKGKGEKKIGNAVFPICDNTLFIVPARAIHSSRYTSTDCSGYILSFNLDFFLSHAFPRKCIINRKVLNNPGRPFINLDESGTQAISAIFECIIQEHALNGQERKEMLAVKVLELLIQCDRLFKETEDHADVSYHPVIARFTELVESKYCLQRSVQYYANVLCMHPNHLNFLLKKHSGLNAKESIDNRIVIESKFLLANSDLIIKEIAHRLGFEDPNNFSTFFQKHTGCSPLVYRSKCHLQHADGTQQFDVVEKNYAMA